MDVSRIEAYNPSRYDWRNMTAKEIIKHDNEGDNVPAIYVEWARDFLKSIYADDVTTYEIAASSKKNDREIKKGNVQAESAAREGDAEVGEEPELSAAQKEKRDYDETGVSILKQAKTFRKKSRSLASDAFIPTFFVLPGLKNASKDELLKLAFVMLVLDARMENIFNNLRNLKSLNEVKDSSENNDSVVQRAFEQGKELDKAALKGHGSVEKTEDKLEDIGTRISAYGELFDSAQDYGSVTVEVGNELAQKGDYYYPLGFSMSKSVIKAGDKAIKQGKAGEQVEAVVNVANNKNIDNADTYHDYIEQKSGVQAPERKEHKNKINDKNDKKNNKEESDTKKLKKDNMDAGKKEDIKKEDKDLPADRETLVKLEDEDKNIKKDFVKNASKKTTMQDAPSKKEFADDNQRTQAANEFERAKENDGADERTVTMALRAESIDADNDAVASSGLAKRIAQSSQSAYNELDENIQDLINEINATQQEIKNEILAVNMGIRSDGISRISQLNEELRSYGVNAQSMASGTEGIINSYAGELDNLSDVFNEAILKGNDAIAGGTAIIDNSADRWLAFRLVNEIIGKNTINIGERTAQDGIKGLSEKSTASSIVNSNLLSIASLKSEIQSRTGIEVVNAKSRPTKERKETKEEETPVMQNEVQEDITKPNLEKPKEKVKDEDKAIKVAQNDGTDTSDKLHTDINAIINRKIRHGEVNMG